jgi:hypothetical protein
MDVFPIDAEPSDAAVAETSADSAETAAPDAADVSRAREPVEGYVEAMTDRTAGTPGNSSIDAHFFSRVGIPPCAIATDGNCTFRLCERGDGGYTYPSVSAGDITAGDDVHERLVVLPYRGSSSDYDSGPLGADYWRADARIDLRGAGDTVAPFAITLHFPAATSLVGFMPEYDSRSVVVDRSRDMPFRWLQGSNGTLTVTISVGTSDASARLECRFDAAFGAGTIQMSQLALLPSTGPDAGSIDIAVVDQMDQVVIVDPGGAEQVVHARAGYSLFRESAGTR